MLGKSLKIGATIGIISPASPEEPTAIKNGIAFLENRAFKVKEGPHIYDKWGYLAGKDEDRASDLNNFFKDDSVDGILCVRGGYGTMRMLSMIDLEVIRNNPKVFIGFSDITAILNYISLNTGLITFHGPMGTSRLEDPYTCDSLFNTLSQVKPYELENPEGYPLICGYGGEAKGKLIGGNLSLITSSIGTPYSLRFEDNILFIEDIDEAPYKIDRMLTHLLNCGALQACSGFIVGQFEKCELPHYERSLTLKEIFEDRLLSLKKPTILGLMTGHGYPKLTIPIGANIEIIPEEGKISVTEAVVK
ncbi:MAG TPA: LD-carboxypeptidase [Clostridiaceae bacterium]